MRKYAVIVPGASKPLCERDSLADATNMAVRWKVQLAAMVVVVDNTTGEVMWGIEVQSKGYTRSGNPCMKHYQGMKHIKRYAKEGNLYKAIFQSGAVFSRILHDTTLTKEERERLLTKFHSIEHQYKLDILH